MKWGRLLANIHCQFVGFKFEELQEQYNKEVEERKKLRNIQIKVWG